MRKVCEWLVFFSFLSALVVLSWSTPARADELTEVLREKGVITKEEWARIKAEEENKAAEQQKRLEEEFPVKVGYGKKGLEFSTRDGRYLTQIQWRLQFRYSWPFDRPPRTFTQFNTLTNTSSFAIRRARIKVGGHGFQPWLKYYFEYDWPSARLLDWRLMIEKYKWLQLRLGQWKINYNRERVDSSGKQQFVERSIVNRQFTLDRQIGVMLYGHLFRGTLADSWYYAGVFTGEGRGDNTNSDSNMMYMVRGQWNFFGRDLQFSQSDVEFHEKPAGSVAVGYATDISPFTRFSGSGGRQLDGFPPGPDTPGATGQYRIDQYMYEVAAKYRGFSLQHEYHWKQIKNSAVPEGTPAIPPAIPGNAATPGFKTITMGSYVQVGYFPHYLIKSIPQPLELAFRWAFVDPNIDIGNDTETETMGVVNWFFAGHRNKLTADFSRLALAQPGDDQDEFRVRLQWDISF